MASEGAIIPQLVESVIQSSPSANCSVPMAGDDTSSNVHTTSIPCQKELVLDEKTKKELFTDTFCRVCGAVLQFESHRISHYEGKKHAQKVRLYLQNRDLDQEPKKDKTDQSDSQVDYDSSVDKNKFCSLCNMVFSSKVVAQSHYVGKIHAKRLKQLTGEPLEWTPQTDQVYRAVSPRPDKESGHAELSTEQHSVAENEIDLSDPNKYCKLCCASFNKPLVAQQHYNGKKHARNEARRKMMEEMQESGMESHVNDGNYVCPICSVTLTSIEMYQSHMQGNKHQIKENIVANVMKTAKKNYDSFQDELADYIKVQKARGLEPKTQFRQKGDPNDSSERDEEEVEDRPPLRHANSKMIAPYKYFDHHPVPYSPYPSNQGKAAWLPQWEKNYESQNVSKMAYYNRKNTKNSYHSSSSQGSSDDHKGSSSDDSSSSSSSSSSYRKDKKRKRRHHKESKHRVSTKTKPEEVGIEKKKQKLEEADSVKDECKKELSNMDKSKHRKDKKKREDQPDRDGKKHKKVKKEGDQRTEEEILWDESILGF